VGDLLVLIPEDHRHFLAYVLDLEDDIEDVQAALGVEITVSWAAYRNGQPQIPPEDEEECIDRRFRRFAEALLDFPTGDAFSAEARATLEECVRAFERLTADDALIRCMDAEYRLFRVAERQVCGPEIARLFRDVDDFLATASSIMNRRKARAGRSLENHVDWVLTRARIPHVMRPNVDGRPDILIPSVEAYRDANYPVDRLVAVGVKTTCKDRWRQVLNEARRVPNKHILTIQQGISANQLAEMHRANVTLVVPREIQGQYPRGGEIEMRNVEQFIADVRRRVAS
jgi:EcoRII C terminal